MRLLFNNYTRSLRLSNLEQLDLRMWTFSESTFSLVKQLLELSHSRSWFGQAKKYKETVHLIERIATENEPAALPVIARFLFSNQSEIQASASRSITEITSKLAPIELLHLDDWRFWNCGWPDRDDWQKVTPSEIARLAASSAPEIRSSVLGITSFHRSGYVRHEAVRRLAAITTGDELPFLLIRLNDWVQPIASDARGAVVIRLNESYLPHLVKSLRLILHLDKLSRHDHTDIVRQTLTLLFDSKQQEWLKTVVTSSDREVRRTIVRLALNTSGDHQHRLSNLGLESTDPIIRLACYRKVPEIYDDVALSEILRKASTDRFMPIRREALVRFANCFPKQAIQTWRHGLFDQSRSIRELARFSLAKLEKCDFAASYREAIAINSELLSAIEGLAETGDQTDINYFRQLLHHPLPSRRCAAIRGLGRTLEGQSFPDCLALLHDDSPRVIREVRNSLAIQLQSLNWRTLFDVALNAKNLFGRENVVMLLAKRGKWPSLPWLLLVAAQADEPTAQFAMKHIECWLLGNKVFTRPSNQQKKDIQEALDRTRSNLPPAITSLVESDLHVFSSQN